jgi:hypothetical protein
MKMTKNLDGQRIVELSFAVTRYGIIALGFGLIGAMFWLALSEIG